MESSFRERLKEAVESHIEVSRMLVERCLPDILRAIERLTETFSTGGILYLMGNGGSATDALHIAGEFVGSGLPAVALTSNQATLTALANDFGYENVFSLQVDALRMGGRDTLVGISTSGRSENVVSAIKRARRRKAHTIALTGEGGELAKHAEVAIRIPSRDTQRIQECHILVGHILWQGVLESLGKKR